MSRSKVIQKILWSLTITLSVWSIRAHSVESVNVDLQNEIAQETQGQPAVSQVAPQPMAAPSNKVYVVNNPQPAPSAAAMPSASNAYPSYPSENYQQQPTTNVVATPLTQSRADQIRKARQDAEVATEQAIVEKLESARLEDEKRRAQALFGNAQLTSGQQPQANTWQQPIQQPPVQQVQVVPVQNVAPAPAEENEEQDKMSLDDVKAELVNTVRDELNANKKKEEKEERWYVSGSVGLTDYSNALNVKSNIASGFTIGAYLKEGFIVEGSFTYSNLYLQDGYWWPYGALYKEVDQMNYEAVVKYSPLNGRFKPQVGALAGYTQRKYTQRSSWGYSSSISDSVSSQALDIGIVAALDLELGKNFVIGGEYKYRMNVTNRTDSPWLGTQYTASGDHLEDMDYSTMQMVIKVLF